MILIRDRDFKTVSNSRNLRGIIEYNRNKSPAVRIDLYRNPDSSGQFGIAFADGASAITDFASFSVMEQFARRRMFKAAQIMQYAKAQA